MNLQRKCEETESQGKKLPKEERIKTDFCVLSLRLSRKKLFKVMKITGGSYQHLDYCGKEYFLLREKNRNVGKFPAKTKKAAIVYNYSYYGKTYQI